MTLKELESGKLFVLKDHIYGEVEKLAVYVKLNRDDRYLEHLIYQYYYVNINTGMLEWSFDNTEVIPVS